MHEILNRNLFGIEYNLNNKQYFSINKIGKVLGKTFKHLSLTCFI